jgi:hypothetical protein
MKSRFLIFTLMLTVICICTASNAMAQSVTGTGVFNPGNGGPPTTVTVSAQQGGNGGVMRFGAGQTEVVGHPIDICVTGNTAFVVAEITHASGDFAGAEGAFLQFGFQDNGKDGDFILVPVIFFISPVQIPACDLAPFSFAVALDRGSYSVKP